jgi:hypothetical protein
VKVQGILARHTARKVEATRGSEIRKSDGTSQALEKSRLRPVQDLLLQLARLLLHNGQSLLDRSCVFIAGRSCHLGMQDVSA